MQFKVLNPLDSGKFYFNKGLYYKVILVVCMSLILFFITNISCSQMSKARFKDFLFLQEYKTQSSSTIATVNSTSSHNSFSLIPYWAFGSDVSPQQKRIHPVLDLTLFPAFRGQHQLTIYRGSPGTLNLGLPEHVYSIRVFTNLVFKTSTTTNNFSLSNFY